MLEVTLLILSFLLAVIGLPAIGIVLVHIYYHKHSMFSWQIEEKVREATIAALQKEAEDAKTELSKIHRKLVDALAQPEN